MDKSKSFDVARLVLPYTEQLLKEMNSLWEIALRNRSKFKPVNATKVEFKEYAKWPVKSPIKTATTAWYFVAWTPVALEVEDTTNFLAWDVLTFQTTDKKAKWDLTVAVISKTSSTELEVQYIWWDNTITLAVWDVAYLDTTAFPEWSETVERRPMYKPRKIYNYTQIVKAGKSLSWTAVETNQYDFKDITRELKAQTYLAFAQKLAWLVSSAVRSSLVINWEDVRIAWWLNYFARNTFDNNWEETWKATANVKNVGWALTLALIDDAFQYVIENEWALNACICSPAQARKISELNPTSIAINVDNKWTNLVTKGWATQVLLSPIQVNWNAITAIFVDRRMPKDELILFNMNNLALIPMQNRAALENEIEYNATKDVYSLDMLWEWTVRYVDAPENSYILTWLTA